MGVDIHLFVEKFDKTTNRWETAEHENWLWEGRNYSLFSKLAGIRHYTKPFKEPVGLPKDLAETTKQFYQEGKGHYFGMTHYSLQELLEQDWMDEEGEGEDYNKIHEGKQISHNYYSFYTSLLLLQKVCRHANWNYKDIRIVMWFDN